MMFRTHILFALFFYIAIIKILSIPFSWPFTLLLCFGAILPDLDSPRSYVNKNYLLGTGRAISFFSEHRGFWHSIFGILIFLIVSAIIINSLKQPGFLIFALPIGYTLHLAADTLNVSGIKWFWIRGTGHLKGKITTGSKLEQLFFITLLLLTIYIGIGNQGIKDITAFVVRIIK